MEQQGRLADDHDLRGVAWRRAPAFRSPTSDVSASARGDSGASEMDSGAAREGHDWSRGVSDVLLLDDDDELPPLPDEAETMLIAQLGEEGLRAVDDALGKSARRAWLKVARVVFDALKVGGFETSDDVSIHLQVRRVIALVDAGTLEAKGDLRRPRWSEVRLRG